MGYTHTAALVVQRPTISQLYCNSAKITILSSNLSKRSVKNDNLNFCAAVIKDKKIPLKSTISEGFWSEWGDSNARSPGPKQESKTFFGRF